ncbi:hypothetical protein [Clostridium pasteurianum]|uniref:Apea-like HEPN domain-containing protein n=1 Tax=Clostridium pasteurianum BC1 TaxID=86416 RepID=R4KAG0_CLOPA|nr:hypothetical protein [Clostridium pasteurianum]AGK96625.1 hypothetical protein Clopa_1703 [Clostridium pasteurianum BC1]
MNLIMFKFFIDFNLGLPTSAFIMRLDNKNICINCEKYNTLNYQTFTSLNIDWEKDKENTRILESNAINKNGDKYLNRQIFFKLDEPFKYGYKDYITSNILVIVFEEYQDHDVTTSEGLEYNYEKAKLFFEKFINKYRLVSNFSFIPNPNSLKLPLIEILICKNKSIKNVYAKEALPFTHLDIKTVLENPFVKGHTDSLHPDDKTLNTLVSKLNQCEDIQLYDKLLLDAKEQAFVKKDYPLCIVLCETAFETFLQYELKKACVKNHIKMLLTYYKRRKKFRPYKLAIENGNVKKDLLTNYLNFIFKVKIESTIEYINWDKNAYKKRNNIIHNGILNFNLKDAENAFTTTMSFIKYIKKLSS